MPYKDKTAERLAARDRKRRQRAREKAASLGIQPLDLESENPVDALAAWAASTLKVPAGHPLAGEPMPLPPFVESWLREAWGRPEALLSIPRKSGKTSAIAVVILGFLAGPLVQKGWQGAVASLNVEKAAKLRADVVAIAEASGLKDKLHVRKSPYPGRLIGVANAGIWHESELPFFAVLSSDKAAGDSLDLNTVITDELGLTEERDREWFNSLRESLTAREGFAMHISIRGTSPLLAELIDNEQVLSHVYQPSDLNCALDDEKAWHEANPAFECGIKSLKRFRETVAAVKENPPDEPSFRAKHLNLPISPTAEMIFAPALLDACFVDEPPPRAGACYVGFDFGEATSGTAAVAIWPKTGRLETWLAFGDNPDLKTRGRRDSADYLSMERRGELMTFPGRIVRAADFLAEVAGALEGQTVAAAAADSYKDSECRDFLEQAGLRWPIHFRRVGAGKDGGQDIRGFQRLIHGRKLLMKRNLSLATAVQKSRLRRDGNGNPGLERASSRGRIDVLSAAVIAAGLAEPIFTKKQRPAFTYLGAA